MKRTIRELRGAGSGAGRCGLDRRRIAAARVGQRVLGDRWHRRPKVSNIAGGTDDKPEQGIGGISKGRDLRHHRGGTGGISEGTAGDITE
jgi:hypothetical protein